ncbi:MAG: family 20 glycosylhydrolase [Clostridia bacterium]|nr:family 20 glycosylhydrolase [Clostridia bacterium]
METLRLVPYPRKIRINEGFCSASVQAVQTLIEPMGEEYSIKIRPDGIEIKGGSAGLRYAGLTLRLLREQFGDKLPCLSIEDGPVMRSRGFMLDVCRHFMPTEQIKRLLDAAALLKLNRFHWHLTDDQGWRLEIKSWPELTRTGAVRGRSAFGICDPEQSNDGYYTQEEVRDIVRYAQERDIETIPEIEIPGHASAMLAAYPWLGCELPDRDSAEIGRSAGIFDRLLCAGKDESIAFIKDVLREVTALFPSKYVHIGGDEALKLRWRRCPCCKRRMKALGITSEDALQRWLVLEIGAYLSQLGKETIVWNDALEGGELPPYFIVQFWRGNPEAAKRHAAAGGRMIDSDTAYAYLDYPFHRIDAWKILSAPQADYAVLPGFLGAEFPLWTEYVADFKTAGRQLFPRLAAGAERAWRGDGNMKDSFGDRWEAYIPKIEALGIRPAPPETWHMDADSARRDRERFEQQRQCPEYLRAMAVKTHLHDQDRMERLMQRIGLREDTLRMLSDYCYGGLDGSRKKALELAFPGIGELAEKLDRAAAAWEAGKWDDDEEQVLMDALKPYCPTGEALFTAVGRQENEENRTAG